jgi:hypothetical protein
MSHRYTKAYAFVVKTPSGAARYQGRLKIDPVTDQAIWQTRLRGSKHWESRLAFDVFAFFGRSKSP